MNTIKHTSESEKTSFFVKLLDGFFVALFFFVVVFVFIGSTGLTYQGHAFDRHIILLFASLLGFLILLGRGVLVGRVTLPKTPLDIPLTIFVGTLLISSMISGKIWYNLWGFWEDPSRGVFAWISYIFLYYWTYIIVSRKKLYWVYGALVLGSIGLIGSTFLERGIFFDERSTLFLSLILFPFSLGLFQTILLSQRKSFFRFFLLVVVLLVIIGIVFVFGKFSYRIDWWWFFLPLAGWFFLIFPALVFQKNRWSWVPMALFFLVGAVYFTGTLFSQQNNEERNVVATMPNKFSWDIAKKSLSDQALFGVGPASYGEAFSLYRHIDLNQTNLVLDRVYQANGLLYELPVTVGITGSLAFTLLFLFFFGFSFFRGFSGEKKNVYLWLSTLISVCIFFAVILFLPGVSSVFAIGFLLIALLLSLGESEKRVHKRVFSLRPSSEYILSVAFVVVVLLGATCYGLYSLFSFFVADVEVKQATFQENNFEQKTASLEYAEEKNPFASRYALLMAQVHLERLMNTYEADVTYEDSEQLARLGNLINLVSENATQAKNLARNDVAVLELVAQIYTNLSFYVGSFMSVAEDVYSEAILLEPQNPRLYVKRGELLVRQVIKSEDPLGKQELILKAKDDFETALSKKEEFSQAWHLLAITQEGLQEIEGAINSASRAVLYSPNDAGSLHLLARLYRLEDKDENRQKAYRLYERSVEIHPENTEAYYALATMYGADGDTPKAIRYYDKILSLIDEENDSELYEKVLKEKAGLSSLPQPEPQSRQENEESLDAIKNDEVGSEEGEGDNDEETENMKEDNQEENVANEDTEYSQEEGGDGESEGEESQGNEDDENEENR